MVLRIWGRPLTSVPCPFRNRFSSISVERGGYDGGGGDVHQCEYRTIQNERKRGIIMKNERGKKLL